MTISDETKKQENVPSKAYDMEYATQIKNEMLFLRERGFRYNIRKFAGEYRIPTYKYTKTPELFKAIAEFYEQRKLGKAYDMISDTIHAANTDAAAEQN